LAWPKRALRALCLAAALGAVAGCASQVGKENAPPSAAPFAAPAPDTLALAERAWRERRYGDARALLDRVLLSDPGNPRAKYLAAELILAQGAPQAAAEAFAALVPSPEVGAVASQGQGIALLLVGDREGAYKSLRRALEAAPTLWRAWNALGYYYDLRGAWEQASNSYAQALKVNPRAAEIYNNRGFSLIMQRRLAEAKANLRRAIRLDPTLDLARDNLRLVLAWEGKYRQALAGVAEADKAKALNNVGYIALMRGDLANAEAFLIRAMEMDPSYNVTASRNLAYLRDRRAIEAAPALGGVEPR